jgi:hypothetical protein
MPATACPFIWYELMTTDAEAAAAFYSQVIGWHAGDAGMAGTRYTLLSVGDAVIAGLMDLSPEACQAGARPGWIGYVGVPDVDEMVARLQHAGGSVQRPAEDIPGVGRFAVVADPHGAAFCLFRGDSDEQPPQPAPGTPGTIGWHELMAGDLDSAWAFYAALFGWTKDEAIPMGEMGVYQLFAADGPAIGGMMTRPPMLPMACWQYYINVDAIDAAIARVAAAGGRIVNGPMQVPGGSWVANGMDPQGAMFALVAPGR